MIGAIVHNNFWNMSHTAPAECPDFWTIMISLTATGWELLSNLFLWVYWHRAKCDIPAEFSVLQTEECVGGGLGTGL